MKHSPEEHAFEEGRKPKTNLKEIRMGVMARTKVFRDEKGNRMIFPGYIYMNRGDEPSATRMWEIGLLLHSAVGLRMETEWFEFDPHNIRNVERTIESRGFAHGSETVYMIAGPIFDEVIRRETPEAN